MADAPSPSSPDASLVVPSYRGERRLPVLFEALRAQSCAANWEVVVVLDGVADDSEAVIDDAGDLPVRVVRFPENRGRPAALNAGFAAARGEVLIRCDDDLEPGPSYVADHLLAHSGPVPVGAVGLYRNVYPSTTFARVYGEPYDERFRTEAYAAPAEGRWRYWAGNCSVTRSVFDEVGDYDERFRSYGWEDIDWGRRLADTGVEVVLDPKLETRHHAANVNTRIRVRRAFLSGRARARFDVKHRIDSVEVPPRGPLQHTWSAAVRGAARARTLDRFERRGATLDRVLDSVPSSLATRAVAFLVESAAIAGYASLSSGDQSSPDPTRQEL